MSQELPFARVLFQSVLEGVDCPLTRCGICDKQLSFICFKGDRKPLCVEARLAQAGRCLEYLKRDISITGWILITVGRFNDESGYSLLDPMPYLHGVGKFVMPF